MLGKKIGFLDEGAYQIISTKVKFELVEKIQDKLEFLPTIAIGEHISSRIFRALRDNREELNVRKES